MPSIARIYSDKERSKLLRRAQTDLWWLLTEVLDKHWLDEKFHKPKCEELDEARAAYHESLRLKKPSRPLLKLWPRDHGKSQIEEGQIVQDFLCRPDNMGTLYHAIRKLGQDQVVAIGKHFQTNETLRSFLPPELMPAKADKKWASASGFRFKCCPSKDPSMVGDGAGAESTGRHSRIVTCDDIIGLNDILDSQIPKKRDWFQSTVAHVLWTRGGWLRANATRWDEYDLCADWIKSGHWQIQFAPAWVDPETGDPASVRKALAGDAVPTLYTNDELMSKVNKYQMTDYVVSCQLQNSPIADTERAWVADQCEHFIDAKEALSGPGTIFVLSDPAPALVGSMDQRQERLRGDATKNYWSVAVGRIRLNGNRMERVLLDGVHSKEWPTSVGFDVLMQQCDYWRTPYLFHEVYGGLGADHDELALQASQRNGVYLFLEAQGSTLRLPRFANSYALNAKVLRMERLADIAKRGEFLISKGCSEAFLYGDKDKTGFLTQMRKLRIGTGGKTNLVLDDDADVTARLTDSALEQYAPNVQVPMGGIYGEEEAEGESSFQQRTLHCGF